MQQRRRWRGCGGAVGSSGGTVIAYAQSERQREVSPGGRGGGGMRACLKKKEGWGCIYPPFHPYQRAQAKELRSKEISTSSCGQARMHKAPQNHTRNKARAPAPAAPTFLGFLNLAISSVV